MKGRLRHPFIRFSIDIGVMNISDRTPSSANARLGRIVLSLIALAASPPKVPHPDETPPAGVPTRETLATMGDAPDH